MVSFGVQNINRTIFLTSKPVNVLRVTLFVKCLLSAVSSSFTCNFNSGTYPLAFLLNRKTSFILFFFNFRTTVGRFYCLFSGFWSLNAYSPPCLFVERIQKPNCNISVRTLSFKKSSGTFFVVSFLLDVFFVAFSCSLNFNRNNDRIFLQLTL